MKHYGLIFTNYALTRGRGREIDSWRHYDRDREREVKIEIHKDRDRERE